jgi:GR25 family glycosyltransferase involved in LPS biosynthesis
MSNIPVFFEKIFPGNKKKIISFSLYGDKPLYYLGAELNVREAKEIYPDYICRFYCAKDVPNLERLKELDCEVIMPNLDSPPVFWRMLALDDSNVDVCLQRDCDSIVNYREKSAVDEWLSSGKSLHFMHDCKAGHYHKIMAGMWGLKNNGRINFRKELDRFFEKKRYKSIDHDNIEKGWGSGSAVYFDDQNFLKDIVFNFFKEDYIEHGEENPFPSHEPIKYGGFVGDRVFASELAKSEGQADKKELFIQSHLSIDDQMPLNGMIRHFCGELDKVYFAVRDSNFNLIQHCLSDLDNLNLVSLKGDTDGVDLYLSNYDRDIVGLLGLGNYGDKVVNCGDFIDCCYAQAGLSPEDKKSKFLIPDEEPSLTSAELSILKKYEEELSSRPSNTIEVEDLNEFADFSISEGKVNLNKILQRPRDTHEFLIKGLEQLAGKYIKPNSVVVEVGSYAGESAEIFLNSGRVDKIYCIDPWENDYNNSDESSYKAPMDFVENMFNDRMAQFGDRVVKLKMPAEEAFSLIEDSSADLVYLDGEHTYEANEKYLKLFNPKLKSDGYMCGHDWGYGKLGETGHSQTEAVRLFFSSDPIDVFQDNSWVYNKKKDSSIDFPFSEALCINLDHRKDRWDSVSNSPISNHCNIKRYSASTIRDELKHYVSCINPKYTRPDIGDTLTLSNSEYGVILSNLSIWHKMVNDNIERLLILEDDVVFKNDSPEYVAKTFSSLPQDWDIVQIAAHSGGPSVNDYFGKFNGPWFIGNWAYGITLSGAKKLLDIVESSGVSGPLDNFIGDNHKTLNIYYYKDMPGTQGDRGVFGSNIDHCGDANSFFENPIL